jgi:hypothetical protein
MDNMAADGLDLELAAMHDIVTSLARLDAPARSRVLVWLRLRFDLDADPTEATDAETTAARVQMVAIPMPIADCDDTLSVEGLDELFDRRTVIPPGAPPPQAVGGLLSELVAEFQDLARDWDRGCTTPAAAVSATRLLPAAS